MRLLLEHYDEFIAAHEKKLDSGDGDKELWSNEMSRQTANFIAAMSAIATFAGFVFCRYVGNSFTLTHTEDSDSYGTA